MVFEASEIYKPLFRLVAKQKICHEPFAYWHILGGTEVRATPTRDLQDSLVGFQASPILRSNRIPEPLQAVRPLVSKGNKQESTRTDLIAR